MPTTGINNAHSLEARAKFVKRRARGEMPKTIAELTKNGKRRVAKKQYKAMRLRKRLRRGQRLERLLALQNLLS